MSSSERRVSSEPGAKIATSTSELASAETEELPRAIPVNTNEIKETRDWIRSADPSLEQIEERAGAEPR